MSTRRLAPTCSSCISASINRRKYTLFDKISKNSQLVTRHVNSIEIKSDVCFLVFFLYPASFLLHAENPASCVNLSTASLVEIILYTSCYVQCSPGCTYSLDKQVNTLLDTNSIFLLYSALSVLRITLRSILTIYGLLEPL